MKKLFTLTLGFTCLIFSNTCVAVPSGDGLAEAEEYGEYLKMKRDAKKKSKEKTSKKEAASKNKSSRSEKTNKDKKR